MYKYLNAMKNLSLQALNNAKSGHPGMAMSASNITYVLYTNFINIDKNNPKWINRDRFVLSGGHGCLSIYSIFHFAELVDRKEILNFRKGSSWYPGHPEYSKNNYIDASTGPLGQGIANGVGMAIAQKFLENRWQQISELIDHYTYIVCGDGDLQEGISYEAMSVAGKLKLNKLIILYDSNDYQLDSKVTDVNNEDIKKRVESQNWNYILCTNEIEEIKDSIDKARHSDKPTFIEVKTIIGEGTTVEKSNLAHGCLISENELMHANKYYQTNYKDFEFPEDIYEHFKKLVVDRGNKKYQEWENKLNEYKQKEPELVQEFLNNFDNKFEDFSKYLDVSDISKINQPTKNYLKDYFKQLNECNDIITLSADLASSTNCKIGSGTFNYDYKSPYIMLGVREFSMSAIQNGILYHGGLKSFAGTFLSFIDYAKSSIRVGAMSKLASNYILTHDTYLVGADGPTHQPYDQIPMLRAIENVYLIRPCDEREMLGGLGLCLNNIDKTYCLILTRQPTQSIHDTKPYMVVKGAYIIYEDSNSPDITLIASGSEVDLATAAIEAIHEAYKMTVKVVSCPSLKLFLEQKPKYIKETIKSKCGVISIEASNDTYWYELSNYTKKVKTIRAKSFGYSKDGAKLYNEKGFNVDTIIKKCQELVNEKN